VGVAVGALVIVHVVGYESGVVVLVVNVRRRQAAQEAEQVFQEQRCPLP